jgi:hypothetical protein
MVYDEYSEETDWALSKCHIGTLKETEEILQNIIKDNPHLLFVRMPTQVK